MDDDAVVERVAKALATHREGGRIHPGSTLLTPEAIGEWHDLARAAIAAMPAQSPLLNEAAEVLRKHQAFFDKMVKHFFGLGALEMDGSDFQTWAKECGLLREEPYDPEKHGPNDVDAEPGDPWYVPSDETSALLSKLEGGK